MKTPLVSIVMPTWNRAERLRKAIATTLTQTFGDFELIVVGGGADGTAEVAAEAMRNDSRVSFVAQDKPGGLPVALNLGFAASRGEFLTWSADDDWFHPEAIAFLVEALRNRPHADLIYTNYEVVDGHGNFLNRKLLRSPKFLHDEDVVGHCFMYRRSVFEKIGDYDPDWVLVEDWEYWLRAERAGLVIEQVPGDFPYSKCDHPESLTETQWPHVKIKIVALLLKYSRNQLEKKRTFVWTRALMVDAYTRMHSWRKASWHAMVDVMFHPRRSSCWKMLFVCCRQMAAPAGKR